MLNIIWVSFFLLAALSALYQLIFEQNLQVFNQMMESSFSMAKTGFEISIGLTGVMTFWLGMMRIGEKAGVIAIITRWVSPIFSTLFPSIPKGHPATGNIMMNLAANMLGLDNAATPLGLKAMKDLQELNPNKDTASDAQIMFMVINVSAVTIIPISIFTYLHQLNYPNPTEVFIPILLATFCSTLSGVIGLSLYQKINLLKARFLIPVGLLVVTVGVSMFFLQNMGREKMQIVSLLVSNFFIFGVILWFLTLAFVRKVNVYEEFITGAKEGFQVAVTLIPYLVAMLVAIGIFRASGALGILMHMIAFPIEMIGSLLGQMGVISYDGGRPVFIDALPTALMKPLSGSGARGMMIETIKTHGTDALVSKMVAVIQGSTETTFYVLAVYFGSVGIKNVRSAPLFGLLADFCGITAAIIITYIFFG
jgi:spore maturation protein SpmA